MVLRNGAQPCSDPASLEMSSTLAPIPPAISSPTSSSRIGLTRNVSRSAATASSATLAAIVPASRAVGQRAASALQVERQRKRVGGHLDRPMGQHRAHHPRPVAADRGTDDEHVRADRADQNQLAATAQQQLGTGRTTRSARGELGDQQQPEDAQQLAGVVREDPHRRFRPRGDAAERVVKPVAGLPREGGTGRERDYQHAHG